jgi:hypothetical protein
MVWGGRNIAKVNVCPLVSSVRIPHVPVWEGGFWKGAWRGEKGDRSMAQEKLCKMLVCALESAHNQQLWRKQESKQRNSIDMFVSQLQGQLFLFDDKPL